MSDEGKCAIVLALWTIAFNAGLLVAADGSKPIGFMLMISSTAILLTYLSADAKVEAERKRRRRYQQDCERRTRKAMRGEDNE